MLAIVLTLVLGGNPVLWRNVEYGMSVDQLHQLYPQEPKSVKWSRDKTEMKRALRVGACMTTVIASHPHTSVVSVEIRADYSTATSTYCADEALAGLISTYGPPASQQTVTEEGWGERKASTWVTAGAAIDYRRSQNGYWNVVYRPVPSGL